MFSLSLTSLVPTVLALSQFFIDNFPNIGWYPYWYLGNPFQYLIGPVIPIFLLILNKVFLLKLDIAYLLLLIAVFVTGAYGLYLLIKQLGGDKKVAFLSASFFILLPFYFLLFTFLNGLHHLGISILPWTFYAYIKFLKENSLKISILLYALITLLILIDISIIIPLLIGSVVLITVIKLQKERLEYVILRTFITLLAGLMTATIWYTPGFWLVLLTNPSFGGAPLINVIKFIYQMLLNLLPIIIAVLVVKWRYIKLSQTQLFGLLFTASFLFLTILRFLSDPDFVIDWIGYGLELQLGLAVLVGSWLGEKTTLIKFKIKNLKLKIYIILILLVTFSLLVNLLILNKWKDLVDNGQNFKADITEVLKKNVKRDGRVFLSGSSVFWINDSLDIMQIRGGVDQASFHPFWADGAYQIREGESADLAKAWMKSLGASFILVHGSDSKEPFTDFKHPEKFSNFALASSRQGDYLYSLEDSYIARIASKEILSVKKPKNGTNKDVLDRYSSYIIRGIPIDLFKNDQVLISTDIKKDEVVSLAITYHPNWSLKQGDGVINKDSLGNMVFIPSKEGYQNVSLKYQTSSWEYLTPSIVSVLLILILIYFDRVYPLLSKRLSKLSLGLMEEG